MMMIQNVELNAICPYYTMYPLSFAQVALRTVRAGGAVLDPFCGRGTTAFAARTRRLKSFNVDISPVAVAITEAKLADVKPQAIIAEARRLLAEYDPDPAPEGAFWDLAYHSETLKLILRLRRGLREADAGDGGIPARIALRGVLLGALHGPIPKTKHSYLSNQMMRTFAPKPAYSVRFWTARGMQPPQVDVLAVVAERAARYYAPPLVAPAGAAVLGDARKLRPEMLPWENIRFDAVVTSPPYWGMSTYLPDQWLRAWLLGGPSSPDYKIGEQIAQKSKEAFCEGLAEVWQRAAELCNPGARLAIRFGGLPSQYCDPKALLRRSLELAGGAWKITRIRQVAAPTGNSRQAMQMAERCRSTPMSEIDVFCRLTL